MKQQRTLRPMGASHDVAAKWTLSAVAVGLYLAISYCAQASESTSTTVLEGKGKPTTPTTLSVSTFVVGSPVTATASGSTDPDDDIINYKFRWCSAAGITAAEPLDGRCAEGATQTFADSAPRYVAAQALTPTGYPQATQGASDWSVERTVVADAPPLASNVVVTGTAAVGSTLTASYTYSDVEGAPEGTPLYQWLRDGVDISDATVSTYLLTDSDRATSIAIRVTPVATTGTLQGVAVTSAGVSVPAGNVIVAGTGTFSTPSGSFYSWSAASSYCDNLVRGDASDWRLPSRTELEALYTAYPSNQINSVLGWPTDDRYYWSSTEYSTGYHYSVYLANGVVSYDDDINGIGNYVTCVR